MSYSPLPGSRWITGPVSRARELKAAALLTPPTRLSAAHNPKLTAEYFEEVGNCVPSRAGGRWRGQHRCAFAATSQRRGDAHARQEHCFCAARTSRLRSSTPRSPAEFPPPMPVMKAGGMGSQSSSWGPRSQARRSASSWLKTHRPRGRSAAKGWICARDRGIDPFVTPAKAAELGYDTAADLDDLLPKVDFLTLHVLAGQEHQEPYWRAELGLMKKSARVLNVARGGITVDEKAARRTHFAAGTIAGAGVDVFTAEPIVADKPLLKAPNVVLTPHLGASTLEAQENVAIEAAQLASAVGFLLKGQIANAVNMAAVNPAELAEVRPYIDLARRLGLLPAQVAQGAVRIASLTYRGELAGQKKPALTLPRSPRSPLEYRLSMGEPRERRTARPRTAASGSCRIVQRPRRAISPRHHFAHGSGNRARHDGCRRHALRRSVRASSTPAQAVPHGRLSRRRAAHLHSP